MKRLARICVMGSLLPVTAFLPADNAGVLRADNAGDAGSSADRGERPAATSAASVAKTSKRAPKITPGREAAALAFASHHHPELRQLLDFLRTKSPQDYRQALADLYQASERIAQFQDRGELERYELELRLWQVRSRIQLVAARIKVRPTDKLRDRLAVALEQELDLRIALRQYMRDKAQQRVSKLDDSILRLSENREQEVQRKLRLLTKTESGKKSRSSADASKSESRGDKQRNSP